LKLELRCPGSFAYAHAVWVEPRLTAAQPPAVAPGPNLQPTPPPNASNPPSAGSVAYLDDLQEASGKYAAFAKHGMRVASEASWSQKAMSWLGSKPAHSLFTHPHSYSSATLTYALDGRYDEFRATVGVLAKPTSQLVFRVYGDEKRLWESQPQTEAQKGVECTASVRGVKTLKLEVYCPSSYTNAEAVWIDPRLTVATQPAVPGPAVASPPPAGGYALRLADDGDQVDTTAVVLQPRNPWTVEGWVTPRDPLPKNGEAALVLFVHPVWLSIQNRGGPKWAVGGPTSRPAPTIYASEKPVAGRRTHVAYQNGPGGVSFYVNGVLQGEPLPIVWLQREASPKIRARGNPAARDVWFQGDVDEVRVSSHERYQGNFTPPARFEPDADTLALYHFDEGQGEVLKDSSGNNRHGKISGGKWVAVEAP
jgi:hypothetical protein